MRHLTETMRTEEQCKPNQRFLFADEYLSDKAVVMWQTECVKRCKDKPRDKLMKSTLIGHEKRTK